MSSNPTRERGNSHVSKVEQTNVTKINWFLMQHFLGNHIKGDTISCQLALKRCALDTSLVPEFPEIAPFLPFGYPLDCVQRCELMRVLRFHIGRIVNKLNRWSFK